MRAEYDQSAAEWDRDRGDYRPPVLADALARGGPFPAGPAVEIASGTGLLTPLIAAVWPQLLAIDLSHGMLRRGAAKGPAAVHRVQADAARLPLPGGSVAAVIIGDGPLFAPELARIMTAGAVLVWSNALGADAPFHVKAPVLLQTMTAATGRTWRAVTSEAWWGSWVILRS